MIADNRDGWTKTRQMGVVLYVLRYAIFFMAVFAVVSFLIGEGYTALKQADIALLGERLRNYDWLTSTRRGVAIGAGLGYFRWYVREHEYKKTGN